MGIDFAKEVVSLSEYKLITPDFVRVWEPHYDARKYPVDFYVRHGESARNAKDPGDLKEALLALLHWKDGHALSYRLGESHAKNLKPILILHGAALSEFADLFHGLVVAEEKDFGRRRENLRNHLTKMWRTGVPIPAFLLHIAKPDRLPIIDQHTVRAFLWLSLGQFIEEPEITWDLWRSYANFFKDAVVASGVDSDPTSRCYVDRALFAYGKELKRVYKGEKKRQLEERACAMPPTKPGFANFREQIDAEALEAKREQMRRRRSPALRDGRA